MLGKCMIEVCNQVNFLVLMADLKDLRHERFKVGERYLLKGIEGSDRGGLSQGQLDKFIYEHRLFIMESPDF